jgi:hypothetical protein
MLTKLLNSKVEELILVEHLYKYLAAILMDLSKAFDCLPHDLLLLKLRNYGVNDSALNKLKSYLSDRKQCVKLLLGICLGWPAFY